MRIVLQVNLGFNDARRFGINPDIAIEGALVDVPTEVAADLLKRGWASEYSAVINAVPPTPSIQSGPTVLPLNQPPKQGPKRTDG
jgi:hypothetical protein